MCVNRDAEGAEQICRRNPHHGLQKGEVSQVFGKGIVVFARKLSRIICVMLKAKTNLTQ